MNLIMMHVLVLNLKLLIQASDFLTKLFVYQHKQTTTTTKKKQKSFE